MVGITFVFMPLIRTRLGGGTVGVNAVCVCLVAVRLSVRVDFLTTNNGATSIWHISKCDK